MFDDAGCNCSALKGLSAPRSLKSVLFTLCTLFTQWDARYRHFGIVAMSK